MITKRGRIVGHIFAFLFCIWGGGQTLNKTLIESTVVFVLVVVTGIAISLLVEVKWNQAELIRQSNRTARQIDDFSEFRNHLNKTSKTCVVCGDKHEPHMRYDK